MNFSIKILFISVLFLFSCEDFFYGEEDLCGVPGGDNKCLDECGVPNGTGISAGECDCNGNILGCDGECGSGQEYDICGVCNGLEINILNCQCDNPIEVQDCLGECGGSAIIDDCGVCNGNNVSCTGCMILGSDNYSSSHTIPDNENCFVSFNSTIQPILDNNCVVCHGNSGGLNLSSYDLLMIGGDNGVSVIPGTSQQSILIEKLMPNPSFGDQMDYLTESMINKISLWIDFGALDN